jgi:glycosyltransferase involved in cell wall biosynthesis
MTDNHKKKILYLCTVPGSGMLPFAAKIINTISQSSDKYEVFGIFVDIRGYSFRNFLNNKIQNDHLFFIESSHNVFVSFIEKIYPNKIIKLINKICEKHQIDLVHCLTVEFSLSSFLYRFQKKTKVLYIVHDLVPHEHYSKGMKSHIMSYIINRGVAKNVKRLNILSTSSRNQFEYLKNNFPAKSVFYHPFPTLVTKQMIEGNAFCLELINVDKYILFFGTLQTYKGVELLYNTFIKNEILYNNYHLVIAGIGEWYFERNESKEDKIIRINRFIDDSEVKNLFQKADCVVYPYTSATQSGVLSIAYYFGCQLVVSDVPFFLDNVEPYETAFVFQNGNSESLKQSILNALKIKGNDLFIEQQKKKYDAIYSERAFVESITSIYESI